MGKLKGYYITLGIGLNMFFSEGKFFYCDVVKPNYSIIK